MEKPVCPKGGNCTNSSPKHLEKFTHVCSYGSKCPKKKDERHMKFFFHETLENVQKKRTARFTGMLHRPPFTHVQGVALEEDSYNLVLKSFKNKCPLWHVRADHMTMYMGGYDPTQTPHVSLGQRIEMKVVSFGSSDKVG
eukprot:TRINITY_DN2314_c0_g1_i6.p1 TRINITY_DN2314_c0_g1~~TRINITY_DN2314_c0_g1_i6.p1  ORF type:complete len:140 (-),score=20.99 TRINITY_DN2314_c0_g1_i6:256-675(-)